MNDHVTEKDVNDAMDMAYDSKFDVESLNGIHIIGSIIIANAILQVSTDIKQASADIVDALKSVVGPYPGSSNVSGSLNVIASHLESIAFHLGEK